jgi:itaconate CoA-transferase
VAQTGDADEERDAVDQGLPLEGITVVALEQAVAGPLATRQLADLGARVIKIERREVGDFARGYDHAVHGTSSYFFWLNRGKESVTLDLKHQRGREVLRRLLERADALVHNLAPGALERIGYDEPSVRVRHPRLVVCGLNGYGSEGPHAGRRAYDLLVQGEVGIPSVTGTPEEGVRVGMSISDIAAGMYAFGSVLAALYHRQRTGRGAWLEVTLLDALTEWVSNALYLDLHGGVPPVRVAFAHPTLAPYGRYACADGDIAIGVQNDREWVRLATVLLERPELGSDERYATNIARTARREEVDRMVGEAVGRLSEAEAIERLEEAGVAYGRLNDMAHLAQHPQFAARGRWTDVEVPGGRARALRPPLALDGRDAPMDAVPALGQHTDAVLGWLGYDGDAVERLHADGVV